MSGYNYGMPYDPSYYYYTPSMGYAETPVQGQSGGGGIAQTVGGLAGTGAGMYGANSLMSALGGSAAAPAAPTVVGATTGAGVPAAPNILSASTPGGAGLMAAVPALGAAAGTYLVGRGAYDLAKGRKGDPLSRTQLAITTGGLSEIPRALGINFASGKDKDQRRRDAGRSMLRQSGMLGNDYNLRFADGSTFDIGKDGGDPRYNVDFSKAGAGDAVGMVNPLAAALFGDNEKAKSDFAGYFANATGGDANKARQLYQQAGLTRDTAAAQINERARLGQFDNATRDAYLSGIDVLFRGTEQDPSKRPGMSRAPQMRQLSPQAPQASGAVRQIPKPGKK